MDNSTKLPAEIPPSDPISGGPSSTRNNKPMLPSHLNPQENNAVPGHCYCLYEHQQDKRPAIAKRSVQPPEGAVRSGQFFFSNKIYVQLSLEQQVRLGAVNPGTQNKCRKIRPWLVLSELSNGNVVVL